MTALQMRKPSDSLMVTRLESAKGGPMNSGFLASRPCGSKLMNVLRHVNSQGDSQVVLKRLSAGASFFLRQSCDLSRFTQKVSSI